MVVLVLGRVRLLAGYTIKSNAPYRARAQRENRIKAKLMQIQERENNFTPFKIESHSLCIVCFPSFFSGVRSPQFSSYSIKTTHTLKLVGSQQSSHLSPRSLLSPSSVLSHLPSSLVCPPPLSPNKNSSGRPAETSKQ